MRKKITGWLAIFLLVIALAFILYALIPSQTVTEVIPVTPTYFVPPVVNP